MGIVYILIAIVLGALGMFAIVSADDPNAPWWMSWVSWFIFTPAFFALFYAMETFGVGGAFALWGAGTALLVIIQGVRWGDQLSTQQIASITLTIIGLVWFGLGG